MSTIATQVQKAYDRIAAVYEQQKGDALSPRLQQLARTIVERLEPQAYILDIGCGTGQDMAWFEAQNMKVTGIDISRNMLLFARERTTGSLIQTSMELLPFCAQSFDAVWCCASLLHIPKHQAAGVLTEIRRVVRRGGLVMISVQEGDSEEWNGGYVDGVLRFFARYTFEELRLLLQDHAFDIKDYARDTTMRRTWLTTLCTPREQATQEGASI
jgi:ubiquinone/menaquinone biosynthesis C-methylase UbiE